MTDAATSCVASADRAKIEREGIFFLVAKEWWKVARKQGCGFWSFWMRASSNRLKDGQVDVREIYALLLDIAVVSAK